MVIVEPEVFDGKFPMGFWPGAAAQASDTKWMGPALPMVSAPKVAVVAIDPLRIARREYGLRSFIRVVLRTFPKGTGLSRLLLFPRSGTLRFRCENVNKARNYQG